MQTQARCTLGVQLVFLDYVYTQRFCRRVQGPAYIGLVALVSQVSPDGGRAGEPNSKWKKSTFATLLKVTAPSVQPAVPRGSCRQNRGVSSEALSVCYGNCCSSQSLRRQAMDWDFFFLLLLFCFALLCFLGGRILLCSPGWNM